MKKHLSLTLPFVGLTSFGILLVTQMSAIALPEVEVMKRLETIPTFVVTDEKRSPVLASIPNPKEKSKKIQVAYFFMNQTDAQNLVNKLKTQKPEIGKSARVMPISLKDAYEVVQKNKHKQDKLIFQFMPNEEQVGFAKTILRQEGKKAEQFTGVPMFVAIGGEDKGLLTIEQNENKIIPFFFRKQDLQGIIDKLKQQNNPLSETTKIQVVSLERLVGGMLKSKHVNAKQIKLIPARDALEYATQYQKQNKATTLNPPSAEETTTDDSSTTTEGKETDPKSVVSAPSQNVEGSDVETASNEIAAKSTPPSSPSLSNPVSSEDIYATARKTTILIQGQNPGSGVIISKKANTYYILTAKHVVETPDEYTIVAPDNKQYEIDYSKVKKLRGVDLAILEFNSDQNYQIADLGDSDQVRAGSSIYVSGWPAPGTAITKSTHLVTEGKLSGFQEDSDGYELLYSNSTAPGMSGGAVINNQGKVVGIHGRAEGNDLSGKVGINLGIPVKLFLKFAPQVGFDSRNLESRVGK